jgi:hypothetical protein
MGDAFSLTYFARFHHEKFGNQTSVLYYVYGTIVLVLGGGFGTCLLHN